MKSWTIVMIFVLACGCSGGSRLGGDGGLDDGGGLDAAHEDAADAQDGTGDPDINDTADVPDDPGPAEDLSPDVECCTPPMVLDRGSGICVDPTGLHEDCERSRDACGFGQLCTQVWGEGPLGYYCHIPCNLYTHRVCPEGYYCDPVYCCDIPNRDCVPDTCERPLLMHPATGECVSTQGLGMYCSITESCNPGQVCMRWTGVDGTERLSCEIECQPDDGGHRVCPNEYHCVDYDDGPQNICEPWWGLRDCDDPGALVCGLPEKFIDVTRDTVCPACYGVHFCVSEGEEWSVQYLFPDGALECLSPGYALCGPGQALCTFPFRSGVEDCPGGRPSDFYWTTVCIAARIEVVQSVRCFYLE